MRYFYGELIIFARCYHCDEAGLYGIKRYENEKYEMSLNYVGQSKNIKNQSLKMSGLDLDE